MKNACADLLSFNDVMNIQFEPTLNIVDNFRGNQVAMFLKYGLHHHRKK